MIAAHVSTTIYPTVERAKPKRADNVRYSTVVANFQIVTATRCSTVIGIRKEVI